MKARVTRKTHSRRENGKLVTYRKGSELGVSERELAAFGDRLTALGGEDNPPEAGPEIPGGTVDQVTDQLPDLTAEQLDTLEQADSRSGVHKAIAEERKRRDEG